MKASILTLQDTRGLFVCQVTFPLLSQVRETLTVFVSTVMNRIFFTKVAVALAVAPLLVAEEDSQDQPLPETE